MANQKDVRRIAMSLPGTSQRKDRFAFSVRRGDRDKDFIWVWNERIAPRKARVPNPGVLAVRVADLDKKDGLLASDKEKFFTEPHYDGFPAILVRLPAVDTDELKQLIAAAWRCFAPRALLEEFERPQERVRPKRGAGPAGESEAAFARLASTLSKDARVDGPDLPHAKGFGSKGLKVARKSSHSSRKEDSC